ncbi:hypothetical protein COO72_00730 [Bifidobacterium callitrichos]|nr:hypothetical protein COO72_00730 [Bifidobacterium callitrichos]
MDEHDAQSEKGTPGRSSRCSVPFMACRYVIMTSHTHFGIQPCSVMLVRDHSAMIPCIGAKYPGSRDAVDDVIRHVRDKGQSARIGVGVLIGLAILFTFGGVYGVLNGVSAEVGGVTLLVCAFGAFLIALCMHVRASTRLPAIHTALNDPNMIGVSTDMLGLPVVYKPDGPSTADESDEDDHFNLANILWRTDRPAAHARVFAYIPEEDWTAMTDMPVPKKLKHGPERLTMITIDVECFRSSMTVIDIHPVPVDAVISEYKRHGEHHVPKSMLVGRGNGCDDMVVGVGLP